MMSEVGHVGPAFVEVERNNQTTYVPLTKTEQLVILWALVDLVKNGQPAERELANEVWRKMTKLYGGQQAPWEVVGG
jgi:hypothetical protein